MAGTPSPTSSTTTNPAPPVPVPFAPLPAPLTVMPVVDQAFREAQRAVHAYDPLDQIQPETGQLYQELTRRQHRARGA